MDLFDDLIHNAIGLTTYAVLGGDADEYARFLQLEWESYNDVATKEQKEAFYQQLKKYKEYRTWSRKEKRNWRDDFTGRDFDNLIV